MGDMGDMGDMGQIPKTRIVKPCGPWVKMGSKRVGPVNQGFFLKRRFCDIKEQACFKMILCL
jgi:hypothetical protein